MEVDPEILRLFATQVDTAAGAVTTVDVAGKVSLSCDSLAGSTTQFTAQAIGTFISGLVTSYADQIAAMGVAVSGVADDFVAQDDAVAQAFDQIWQAP